MISYELKRVRRARHARISVREDCTVLVTAPTYVTKKWIATFVNEQQEWVEKQIKKMASRPVSDLTTHSRQHFLRNKTVARRLVNKKLAQWNKLYGFSYARVSIRSMRTRWGSCSSQGNLSFHYKTIFLPEALQDYLIVHELCHLQEMNHSKNFWSLVARAVPDYRLLRKQLQIGN